MYLLPTMGRVARLFWSFTTREAWLLCMRMALLAKSSMKIIRLRSEACFRFRRIFRLALKIFATAYDFVVGAEDYLERYAAEARIHYRVAVAHAVREVQPTDHFFAANIEEGKVCGIALCTSPWKGLLSGYWAGHMSELVRALHDVFPQMPGIMGPPAEAVSFAHLWCDLTGMHPAEGVSERWYVLEDLTMPVAVPGEMMTATEAHLDTVTAWMEAFWEEAGLHDAVDARAQSMRAVERGLFHFWCVDGAPVAMAGHSGPVGKLVSIGPVYTDPQHRRKGYGSNLVAHLSQRFLQREDLRCGLGADRDNPHSQKIYQRMGYLEVAEMEEIRFIGPLS